MPNEFFEYQEEYNPVGGQDQEVVNYFTANNITLYSLSTSFNITADDDEVFLEDVPAPDHQLEFWFYLGNSGNHFVQIRHAEPWFWFWLIAHYIEPIEPFRTEMSYTGYAGENTGFLPVTHWQPVITRANLFAIADGNDCVFEASCTHVSLSLALINANITEYDDFEESFDAGELTVFVSYEIDFDAMKPTAFTLIVQLITFQQPDFGLPGDFGSIVNYSVGIVFWIAIAIIIYTIVTRLIPTIPGGIED